MEPGTYTIETITLLPWGGVNATDALSVLKHFAGITPLSDLNLLAGDVNNTGYVNSSDALLIAKRFTQLINSFQSGDWVFDHDSFTITAGENTIQDIHGLCYGDVNASLQLGAKEEPSHTIGYVAMELSTRGVIDMPVNITFPDAIGALSLVLHYDDNILNIDRIYLDNPGQEANLVYNARNGELRISYAIRYHQPSWRILILIFSFVPALTEVKSPEHISHSKSCLRKYPTWK